MSNEGILVSQIATILAVVGSYFGLYRLLVSQKDAIIQLLKERLDAEKSKVEDLKSQTPDALVQSLSKRITTLNDELTRLSSDGAAKESEVLQKEQELNAVRASLLKLTDLIEDSDLLCQHCSAPLLQRAFENVSGWCGGREVDGDIEHREYECGATFRDSEQTAPCRNNTELRPRE